MAVRPGEVFAAALLARRAHVPTKLYCKHLLHFCAYCLATKEDRLVYGRQERTRSFRTHVDSSWANDVETSRSWFGYNLCWGGAAFAFRAKLEPVVALSSRDAEAIAAVFAVKAILGFAIILRELRLTPGGPFPIWVDNKATVDGAHSDKVARDSRHQAMRLAWLRDVVREELVQMSLIPTGENTADIHTKVLSGPAHSALRKKLMGMASSTPNPA